MSSLPSPISTESRSVTLGIGYNDTTQAAKLGPSDRQQALYCIHQLFYCLHVPDDLHPGAGDSTGVQSVQFSNMLLLRPSSVE